MFRREGPEWLFGKLIWGKKECWELGETDRDRERVGRDRQTDRRRKVISQEYFS